MTLKAALGGPMAQTASFTTDLPGGMCITLLEIPKISEKLDTRIEP